ncbi:MAG: CAP domain-containing protein [Dehalococcoidia bacterium]|nr:CAP domain-containing protein [Dehalococcoidia bacterium]
MTHRAFLALTAVLGVLVAPLLFGGARPATAGRNCAIDNVSMDSEETAFLGIINDYRAGHGLRRLTLSANLNREAEWMANDMPRNSYFGHTDSLGRDPWTRSVDCGYPIPAGENLAAGTNQGTAAAAFALFQSSPSHNENMLGPDYRQMGVARVFAPGSKYGWYWATEFGTTDDGAALEPLPLAAAASSAEATTAPAAPSAVNAATDSVGEASFRPVPLPTSAAGSRFSWPVQAEAAAVESLLTGPGLMMVYRWDQVADEWRHFGPGLPAYVQTLTVVAPGESYIGVGVDLAGLPLPFP